MRALVRREPEDADARHYLGDSASRDRGEEGEPQSSVAGGSGTGDRNPIPLLQLRHVLG